MDAPRTVNSGQPRVLGHGQPQNNQFAAPNSGLANARYANGDTHAHDPLYDNAPAVAFAAPPPQNQQAFSGGQGRSTNSVLLLSGLGNDYLGEAGGFQETNQMEAKYPYEEQQQPPAVNNTILPNNGDAEVNKGFNEAIAPLSVAGQKGPPAVSLGFKEAMRPAAVGVTDNQDNFVADQDEPEPEEEQTYNPQREFMKCTVCAVFVWLLIFGVLIFIFVVKSNFDEPVCLSDKEILRLGLEFPESCEPCGGGTLILPLGGEWEKSWNKVPVKMILYFVGLGWCFLGVGICCDQFMAAIEEITAHEKLVWLKVHGGARHKFHVRVWNATVANLTLMALGSSAPEILLSVIELMGDGFFSGELGPSTIVGSASFNLLVITAVCVSAIPAPDIRKIDQTDVFAVTASVSVIAYVWLLLMLQVITPDMVDVWEALVTFIMFPALVIIAFAADRGYVRKMCACCRRKVVEEDGSQLEEEQRKLQVKYGKSISMTNVKILMEEANKDVEKKRQTKSRAQYRAGIMQSAAGGGKGKTPSDEITFGFKDFKHVVLECAGAVELKVVASRQPCVPVSMKYCTRDGQAKQGVRYQQTEGTLMYEPHETEKIIQIPIIDNDTWEAEEEFTVELANLEVGQSQGGRASWFGGNAQGGGRRSWMGGGQSPSPKPVKNMRFGIPWTSVWILNDDEPGMLSFAVEEVMACQGVTSVTIGVCRTNGTTGAISCHYETQEDSALRGYDFTHVEGTVEFGNGQANSVIDIPILVSQPQALEKRFRIVLNEPSPGVKFDPETDGGDSCAICEVILPSISTNDCRGSCAKKCSPGRWRHAWNDWKEQFPAAFYCSGDAQEQSEASFSDWVFHGIALFWKTIFAVTPPARLGGGWPCFFWALGMIGAVTAIVGDMAKLLGCCMGIPDGITAITLVALGTSLPDTFASRTAAQHDDCADNSIGNVTGSNSVNVFLGLGLPWSVGALVWSSRGATQEWQDRIYKGKTYKDHGFMDRYPDGGFLVPAGSLAFSVLVFVACALVCIGLLVFRRFKYGGELGGPQFAQRRDMIILVCLWFVYIAASCIKALSEE